MPHHGGAIMRIDYFFSVLSPYTYLAGDRPERIAAAHGAELVWRPMDIMTVFARTGGVPVPQRHPSRQAYRLKDLARCAALEGMPINVQPAHFPTNPAPASYAIIAAQNAGGGDLGALVRAILRAVWAEEKDIAEDAVVRAALEEAGFDPALADRGLVEG
ncbi:MAG: 2-hydroxychromene-2-carboxylate isomerase, partial [Alphaproteobacteria bacterium]